MATNVIIPSSLDPGLSQYHLSRYVQFSSWKCPQLAGFCFEIWLIWFGFPIILACKLPDEREIIQPLLNSVLLFY